VGIKAYSVLDKLRASVGRAEANLQRCQTRYDDLRARWKLADEKARPGLAYRGRVAKMDLDDATAYLAHVRQDLKAEERRLLQPDTFLRFS